MRDDFEAYVRGRGPALYRTAYLLVGEPQLAEDLVQNVLASAWRRWERVSRTDHLDAYLTRALVNQAISLRRRRSRRPETLLPTVPDRAGPGVPDGADTALVLAALAQLPPRQRAVVVLRYYEDRSERDIAEALGVSLGTVKSQASKAIRSLRLTLGATWKEDVHD